MAKDPEPNWVVGLWCWAGIVAIIGGLCWWTWNVLTREPYSTF